MEFNRLQTVKRSFFSRRNGVTADVLRKAGSPFKIIFGLNLPQLNEIAREMGQDKELARQLWHNRSTRCSMLLAPILYPADEMTLEEAIQWCEEVPSTEVADILCNKLLVKTGFRETLIERLLHADKGYSKYMALRLILYVVRAEGQLRGEWKRYVNEALSDADSLSSRMVAIQITDEISEEWK